MQQADPGSSSFSESLGHGDRDSSLVAAIGGENSRKDGVTQRDWGECKKNLQRDPLPLHSAWGWGSMTHFSTARVHTELLTSMAKVERVFTGVLSCWYGKINTRIKTNLTCPSKY